MEEYVKFSNSSNSYVDTLVYRSKSQKTADMDIGRIVARLRQKLGGSGGKSTLKNLPPLEIMSINLK
jgi:hypothetical protein